MKNRTEKNLFLIADDSDHLRRALVWQLEGLGIKAECVENGFEAVERARRKKYTLIIMDVEMPVMNGLDASSAIRAIEEREQENEPVLIIALTGGVADRKICMLAGMNDFYQKPLLLVDLEAILRKWLPGLIIQ